MFLDQGQLPCNHIKRGKAPLLNNLLQIIARSFVKDLPTCHENHDSGEYQTPDLLNIGKGSTNLQET
jgi:hypothetical protein